MWSLFRNCRKACDWRYLHELVPLERDHNLSFGSLIHECLEIWHRDRDLERVLDHIDRACSNRAQDERELRDWHLATAMMKGYAARYSTEEFEVVALEKTFSYFCIVKVCRTTISFYVDFHPNYFFHELSFLLSLKSFAVA